MAQETKPERNARLLNAVKDHSLSASAAFNLLRELPATCLRVTVGGAVTVRPVRDDLMDTVQHSTGYSWTFYASKFTTNVYIECEEIYDDTNVLEWADVVANAKLFKPLTNSHISAIKFGVIDMLDDMTFEDQKVFARLKLSLFTIPSTETMADFQQLVWDSRTPQEWVIFLNKNPLTHQNGDEEE